MATIKLKAPSGGSVSLVAGDTASDVVFTIPPTTSTIVTSDVLAAPTGSSLAGYIPAGVGAVATDVESKLREGVSVKDFGAVGDGSDESVKIQAAVASGAGIVYFPDPQTYYKFGGVTCTTRGQRLVGSGFQKCAVVPMGTHCFTVKEFGVDIEQFWFRPATVVTGQQDATNTTNLVYIEHPTDVNRNIDGFRFHDNYCQDIAAAAIYIKSGLRESHIYRNQFRGMGNVASSLGHIHSEPNATFTDSSNYVWITDNVFYRAEKPFIYLKAVAGSNPDEHYYDHWFIKDNLFHGNLLIEPGGIVGGDTHMVYMNAFAEMMFEGNTFTSFNGAFSAIYADYLNTWDKNKGLYIKGNRFFVDDNGVYTGKAVIAADCFDTVITGNVFKAGFQTVDIQITNSGTFAYTPRIDTSGNLSSNQFNIAYTLPGSFAAADYRVGALNATSVTVTGAVSAGPLAATSATVSNYVMVSGGTVTIATGVVTITTGRHFIDTEGATATDDLVTINGGANQQLLVISPASSSRDVTVKDGMGNLMLAGDFTMLTLNDRLTLMKEGSNWVELSRSTN